MGWPRAASGPEGRAYGEMEAPGANSERKSSSPVLWQGGGVRRAQEAAASRDRAWAVERHMGLVRCWEVVMGEVKSWRRTESAVDLIPLRPNRKYDGVLNPINKQDHKTSPFDTKTGQS
jgi:hypothetical protein